MANQINIMNKRYPCACCKYYVYEEDPLDSYWICPVCFWEQDSSQEEEPDFDGGANDPSLIDAQKNFAKFGAYEERHIKNVRPPLPEELPENNEAE